MGRDMLLLVRCLCHTETVFCDQGSIVDLIVNLSSEAFVGLGLPTFDLSLKVSLK